ncbi:hypothetical protein TFLX_04418 [Thermoflexales bacterium]|nr:hypothetical protein TFLX_04418 [Thermoflexales bacterium]
MNTNSHVTRYALVRSLPVGLMTLLLALVLNLLQPLLANAVISERRFGAIDTFDNPAAAAQLGAGWTRVRFPWADMQPNDSGQWNTAFFTDEQLARELAAGREVVGLIVNTPPWALQDGSVPGVPSGLYLREDDPNNVWATFVRRLVSQYAGRIDHWIIWNEPDIWEPSYPGRTWGSDEKEFLQLLRIAYNVIKQTNPNATVHLSAFTYYWDTNYGRTPFFKRLLDEMQKDRAAAEHNYYFDVASANLYFRTDNIYDLTAWHHQQMREHGFDKPIWLTETNAAPSTDPAWPVANPTFAITLDEQAHFIIQSMAMALAAGANRVAIYKLADVPADRAANPEPFGLVREDGSRRPAFSAFQVGANYLAGFTEAALTERNELYTLVTVKRGDSGWTSVAWTRQPSPQTISVPAHADQATLVNWNGSKQTIAARDGKYEIEIAGATCTGGCLIGGAPRLIVEGAVGSAQIDAPSNPVPNVATATLAPATLATATFATTAAAGTTAATEAVTSTAILKPTQTSTPTASVTATATRTATASSTATRRPTSTPTPTAKATLAPSPTIQPTLTPPATTTETSGLSPLLIIGGLGVAAAAIALYVIPRATRRS